MAEALEHPEYREGQSSKICRLVLDQNHHSMMCLPARLAPFFRTVAMSTIKVLYKQSIPVTEIIFHQ